MPSVRRKGEGRRLPAEIADGGLFRHRSSSSQICHRPRSSLAPSAQSRARHMAKSDHFCNRAEAYEAHDDVPLSPRTARSIGDIILKRYSRREMMRGTLGVAAAASLFGPALLASRQRTSARLRPIASSFEEVEAGVDATHHVADGYQADVLLRWGDPLFPDSPRFRSAEPERRGATQAIWLQQRLRRVLSAR